MIEKQAIFFLIIAITLSSACRPMKADPVAQSTKPEQPLVTGSDKLTQGSNPTVAEEATSPSIDVEDPTKPQLVETPPITPETKLYYNYPTKADYDAGVFPSYVDPKCVEYLQESNEPIELIDPCYFTGNMVVLARFTKPISKIEHIEGCVNNRYQRYVNHDVFTIEILHVFKGRLDKKQIDMKIFGMDGGVWAKKGDIAILGLYKDKSGNYISTGSAAFLNLDPESSRIHKRIVHTEMGYKCQLVTLPTEISDLTLVFNSFDKQNSACNKQEQELKDFFEMIKNEKWGSGKTCSNEMDNRRRRKEMEINSISGRKVPCPTCPEGYAIEDLSVDEYMDKVNQIMERSKK